MVQERTVVVAGTVAEYQRFADLVGSLSDDQWSRPTRCSDWTVADVAAHVSGQLSDIVNFRLDGIGTPEVTQREVDERRGKTPGELADELRASTKLAADLLAAFDDEAWNGPAPGPVPGTLGTGIEALWADAWVHADDIASAIGGETDRGPGLTASLSHYADVLTELGWGPATLRLDGAPEFAVSGGGGREITGDPVAFVLAATGRGDPAALGLDDTVNVYRG